MPRKRKRRRRKRGGYAPDQYHGKVRRLTRYNKFMRDYLQAHLPTNPTREERRITWEAAVRHWHSVRNTYVPSY